MSFPTTPQDLSCLLTPSRYCSESASLVAASWSLARRGLAYKKFQILRHLPRQGGWLPGHPDQYKRRKTIQHLPLAYQVRHSWPSSRKIDDPAPSDGIKVEPCLFRRAGSGSSALPDVVCRCRRSGRQVRSTVYLKAPPSSPLAQSFLFFLLHILEFPLPPVPLYQHFHTAYELLNQPFPSKVSTNSPAAF